MSKDKRFSFEDDPAFSNHDEKWWAEWRRNQQQRNQPPPRICDGCLNEVADGTCDIHGHQEQSAAIGANKCADKID